MKLQYTHNHSAHDGLAFSSCSPNSSKQKQDCEWNDNNSEFEFNIVCLQDDDNKLYGEAEKEEKVELEQCDKNLICEIATLHPEICRNVLVNAPGELIVELPADDGHENSSESMDTWDCNQEGLDRRPYSGIHQQVVASRVISGKPGVCFLNLLNLDSAVDQQSEVKNAKSDDLDSVLQAQSIINQCDEKYVPKDEQCEVGWNGSGLWWRS